MQENQEVTVENHKEVLVVKSNNLIMSRYNLSIAEQRLILQVVSMINKDDEDFKNYKVHVSDYLDLIDSNSPNTYQKLKEFSETLLKKPLHIPKDDGGFFVCNWFAGLEYEPKKGVLFCSFHPNLKPYLLQLKKNFTSYRLKNILSLSSKYSIRLYEILKRYEGLGEVLIDLIKLRELLSIPDSYFYKNIKQRILKPLQKEFQKHTDIAFNFEEIKNNKKVTALKFTINSNLKTIEKNHKELTNVDYNTKSDNKNQLLILLNELSQEKRTQHAEEMLIAYLEKYDINYLKKQIEYTNKQKPRNYFAYLIKAIEKNYAGFDAKIGEEERIRRQKIFERKLQELEKERLHDIEADIFSQESVIYREYLNTLDSKEKQIFLKKYTALIKEVMPEIKENSYEMEFQAELLATKDIILENEAYQIRLAKAGALAEKEAQIKFERKKRILENELANNAL